MARSYDGLRPSATIENIDHGEMMPPIESFQQVLLGVWQEACRHIEIGESTANIARLLRPHLPVEQVLVRRLDRSRSGLETVAVGVSGLERPPKNARPDCSADEWKWLIDWRRRGRVAHRGNLSPGDAAFFNLLSGEYAGDVLAGPLGEADGNGGVLVFLAAVGRNFGAAHIELAQRLLEPFSVALENDHRQREMNSLREAAEADRQSLLARLGRKSLGDTIIGVESGLREVMERVKLVAPSDAPVLIFGETGSGKELIARAIHERSSRRSGPFHRVNCGAIPPELIDSQLFGHERGAFTGAVESRRGWFERAHGGTLFLDEIGELPSAAQVRMLRILQDGWMERVGAEKAIHVDVRIIAATHRDLAAMVAQGRFRQDLWYRVAVFPMVLPPLRERRDDIAGLARHFAERAATRFGLPAVGPTPADLAMLRSYPWPGNVRELAAVIDRAAILGNGKRLDVATALGVGSGGGGVAEGNLAPAAAGVLSSPESDARLSTPLESLEAAMRRHIQAALRLAEGRIEGRRGAAAMLKINPHTLRARMRNLGIDWARFRPKAGESGF